MKLRNRKIVWTLFAGAVVLGLSAAPVFASQTNLMVNARTLNNGAGKSAPEAKKAPASPGDIAAAPVPVATFGVPRKVVDGRDPFFPNSSRVYGTDTTVKPNLGAAAAADLVLRGISGTPEQPLAIINTTTFTVGESNEVLHKNGRVSVQCVAINMAAGTVVVQIGSDRRELSLAPAN